MRTFHQALFPFLALSSSLFAQQPDREFTEAIEDNSFFIEEAYNQESGVVQHISTLLHLARPTKDFSYSFTQEWPVNGQTHQLSVTIPYMWVDGNSFNGLGDVFLNYRYQLLNGNDWAAVAPRFSVIFPVGHNNKGLGNGVWGVQVNLPASKRLTNYLIVHANAGATILPNVKATTSVGAEVRRTLSSFNIGASAIVLASQQFNVMMEVNENFLSEIDEKGETARPTETVFSTGFRAAIDVGELQIVPGLAVPFSFTGGEQWTGFFFYLSFEHPF